MNKFLTLFLFFILNLHNSALAQESAFFRVGETAGIEEYILSSNGLRVLIHEDRNAPVLAVMTSYQCGSKHEFEGERGAAHLLEHMMFRGSQNFNSEKGTDMNYLLRRVGAIANAMTTVDATHYYEIIPSDQLELALKIEADRMRGALLKDGDIKRETQVVISELERDRNDTFQNFYEKLMAQTYPNHPYHHPTIGYRKDLEAMTAEKLRKFYEAYYWPNHAIVSIIGDVDKVQAFRLIEKYFGSMPKKDDLQTPAESYVHEVMKKPIEFQMETFDPLSAVVVAFKIPEATHSDYIAVHLLAQILAGGESSPFYRELVHSGLANQIESVPLAMLDPGIYMTVIHLSEAQNSRKVQKKISDIIKRIQKKGIDEATLNGAKRQLKSAYYFARDGAPSMIFLLSQTIGAGDWKLIGAILEKSQFVTAEEIQKVARTYLSSSRMVIGRLISKSKEPMQNGPMAPWQQMPESRETDRVTDAGKEPLPSLNEQALNLHITDNLQREKIGGIQLITLKTSAEKIVTVIGSFLGAGYAFDQNPKLAELTSAMLGIESANYRPYEIFASLESNGMTLSFAPNYRRMGFTLQCLNDDLEKGVEYLAEIFKHSRFSDQELANVQNRLLGALHLEENNPEYLAETRLSQFLYPANHPGYGPDVTDQVKMLKKIESKNIENFYEQHFGPKEMFVVAVGDVSHVALSAALKKYFDDWPTKELEGIYAKEVNLEASQKDLIEVPDKMSLEVSWALGIPITKLDSDYLNLLLGNFIFGGDMMHSRLYQSVREKNGYSYAIYSYLSGFSDELQGAWKITMMTQPNVMQPAMQLVQSEVQDFVNKGVSAEEIQLAKYALIGQYKIGLSSTQALATALLSAEENALGTKYLDEFPRKINQLDQAGINQAIKKYLIPDKMHSVVVGEIFQQENKAA